MAYYYEERSRNNIAKLATETRKRAREWFDWCCENKIEVLVYETIRTLEQQKLNVANGKSQTLKSYHIVGQAFDFVMSKNATVDWGGYKTATAKKTIAKAKSLGFTWGGDWSGFVDCPHMQFEYKGYGTDRFSADIPKPAPSAPQKTGKQGVFAKTNLNIRTKSKWDSPVAFKIPEAYYAQILWDVRENGWVQVEFQGKKGWFSAAVDVYWHTKNPNVSYTAVKDVLTRADPKWGGKPSFRMKKGETVNVIGKTGAWLKCSKSGVIGYLPDDKKHLIKK
ncbi:M15 family metallopeptidase [Listeria booriae]|uniref:M15 family metallopeptidase n=1 Tax=Listeria booriae TaxID=1552123 RepID=UPI0016274D98|nr:M15 family metallopeptidase [Listeria booriae]MBC2048195.1 hypothetical protein [Listeria booriae]